MENYLLKKVINNKFLIIIIFKIFFKIFLFKTIYYNHILKNIFQFLNCENIILLLLQNVIY